MADHSKPLTTSTYSNFVTELDGRFDDITLGLDPANVTATNVPTNAIRWTSASSKWQKYNGTSWADLSSAYSININGTIGATTPNTGAFTTLSATGNVTLGDASADTVTINGTVAAGVVVSGSTATDAFRITQTGAGNAFVVEDDTNPDSSSFVIDTNGRIIDGYTSALSNYSAGGANRSPQFQIQGSSTSFATQSITNWASGTTVTGASYLILSKSPSGTVGTQSPLSAADQYIGVLQFSGDDGTNFIPSAWIRSATDGTPGANDMPGRLEFATTADGQSSPTERMRIDSSGRVGIGTTSPSYNLDVTGTIRATGDITAFSDIRVKTNLEIIKNPIEILTKINGYYYTRSDIYNQKRSIGLIAQELLDVLPEVVSEDKNGLYSVSYGNIIALLVEALKEEANKRKELEERIFILENKLING